MSPAKKLRWGETVKTVVGPNKSVSWFTRKNSGYVPSVMTNNASIISNSGSPRVSSAVKSNQKGNDKQR